MSLKFRNYTFARDQYGWRLTEERPGVGKDGNPKPTQRVSFYANIVQAAQEVLDREAGKADDIQTLLAKWTSMEAELYAIVAKASGALAINKRRGA